MLDEVHALWLFLNIIVTLLDVSWKVSVSGVVDMLSWEEVVWLVELIKLLWGKMNVVLNTITIGIIDLPSFVSVLKILRSELNHAVFHWSVDGHVDTLAWDVGGVDNSGC